MAKKAYPEHHRALLDQSVYPSATRRIKFEETRRSYLYRTGAAVYKIRKPSPIYSSLAVKEAYAHEAVRLGRVWAPGCGHEVVAVRRSDGGFALSGPGEVVDYAVRMDQLPGHHWVHELQPAGRLNATAVGRIARFLAARHEEHPLEERRAGEAGRPEHLRSLLEEVIYQAKKFTGQTITPPMIDMITRPVDRFIEEARRLFLRRQRRGRVVEGHGAFLPEHVYLRGRDVLAVSPLDSQAKYRQLDAANDLATLRNELVRMGGEDNAELLLKRYLTASKDRELARLLPVYETYQAMRRGLDFCELMLEAGTGDKQRQGFAQQAHDYFNLAVRRARECSKAS